MDEEIRTRFDQLLGLPLSDKEWRHCLDEGWVEKIRNTREESRDKAIFDTVARLQLLRHTFHTGEEGTLAPTPGRTNVDVDEDPDQLRIYVVGRLLVSDAEKLPALRAFREAHLEDGLLDVVDDLEPWLFAHCRETFEPPRGEARHLKYLDPIGRVKSLPYTHIPYARGGVVQQLGFLGRQLNERYGWSEEQAVNFVLCGSFPFADEYEVKIVNRTPFGAATRIMLTLDPALTPTAVAKLYGEQRERILGKRYRSIDRKHTVLAWQHSGYGDRPWSEQMQVWNRKQEGEDGRFGDPAWTYTDVRLFHRDTTSAVRRLLREGAKPTYERKDRTEADE
jgi:hypothetical protein